MIKKLILASNNAKKLRELRELFGVTEDSVFLLVSTEGDTDPDNYRRITA